MVWAQEETMHLYDSNYTMLQRSYKNHRIIFSKQNFKDELILESKSFVSRCWENIFSLNKNTLY